MWQWWNCAAEHAPAGLELLRINLDETAVCLFQGGGKGTVICRKRRLSGELVQRVKAGAKRTYLTHIALVCDRPELQPLLPQVVIGNEATFRAGDLQTYQAACPRNVHLLRQQSAWSNIRVCLRVIQLLGAALRAVQHPPLVRRWQPVLVMDACRLHLHRSVAEACWRQGVCLVIVPAKMTWLLQPLDTHAFRLYKQHLREEWQRARQQTLDGDVTVGQCLGALCSTIRHVLQGHEWARAFDEDGFGQGQRLVTARILQRLELDSPPNLARRIRLQRYRAWNSCACASLAAALFPHRLCCGHIGQRLPQRLRERSIQRKVVRSAYQLVGACHCGQWLQSRHQRARAR